jgi:hypothetical protein
MYPNSTGSLLFIDAFFLGDVAPGGREQRETAGGWKRLLTSASSRVLAKLLVLGHGKE